jgi:GR25 family glycosyltransferase involved in LPS biosynthesis
VEKNKTILVLEHDAVFTGPLPDVAFDSLLNLGVPSWGKKLRKQTGKEIVKLTTKKLHGTHGYLVSPRGAKQLIASAQSQGVWPADQFLCRRRFRFIQEYFPHPIKAVDEFSTIQKTDLGRGYKTVEEMWKT